VWNDDSGGFYCLFTLASADIGAEEWGIQRENVQWALDAHGMTDTKSLIKSSFPFDPKILIVFTPVFVFFVFCFPNSLSLSHARTQACGVVCIIVVKVIHKILRLLSLSSYITFPPWTFLFPLGAMASFCIQLTCATKPIAPLRPKPSIPTGSGTWFIVALLILAIFQTFSTFSNSFIEFEGQITHFCLVSMLLGAWLPHSLRASLLPASPKPKTRPKPLLKRLLAQRVGLTLVVALCVRWLATYLPTHVSVLFGGNDTIGVSLEVTSAAPYAAIAAAASCTAMLVVLWFVQGKIGDALDGSSAFVTFSTRLLVLTMCVASCLCVASELLPIVPQSDVRQISMLAPRIVYLSAVLVMIILSVESPSPKSDGLIVFEYRMWVAISSFFWVLCVVLGASSVVMMLCCGLIGSGLLASSGILRGEEPLHRNGKPEVTTWAFVLITAHAVMWGWISSISFFASGHAKRLSALRVSRAFVGFESFNLFISGFLLILDTFGCHILATLLFLTVLVHLERMACYSRESNEPTESTASSPAPSLPLVWVEIGMCVFLFYHAFGMTLSVICVTMHRRHLMVWEIFAPKFMFDACITLVVEVTACCGVMMLLGLCYAQGRANRLSTYKAV
jgi:hypothetical protein